MLRQEVTRQAAPTSTEGKPPLSRGAPMTAAVIASHGRYQPTWSQAAHQARVLTTAGQDGGPLSV